MSQPPSEDKADFEKIRAQARAIVCLYGGKLEINEWRTFDGEFLKLVFTWKKQLPTRQPA